MISVDGPQCTCGRKGCFEVYSSATGLVRMTKEALAAKSRQRHEGRRAHFRTDCIQLYACRRCNCKAGSRRLHQYLAAGITNTINIFQPDILHRRRRLQRGRSAAGSHEGNCQEGSLHP
ncbi:MAG: ROK family protein [Ruminococcus sp.]